MRSSEVKIRPPVDNVAGFGRRNIICKQAYNASGADRLIWRRQRKERIRGYRHGSVNLCGVGHVESLVAAKKEVTLPLDRPRNRRAFTALLLRHATKSASIAKVSIGVQRFVAEVKVTFATKLVCAAAGSQVD